MNWTNILHGLFWYLFVGALLMLILRWGMKDYVTKEMDDVEAMGINRRMFNSYMDVLMIIGYPYFILKAICNVYLKHKNNELD